MAERSNAAVLKTVDCYRSGGSNPSLSAKALEHSRAFLCLKLESNINHQKPNILKKCGKNKIIFLQEHSYSKILLMPLPLWQPWPLWPKNKDIIQIGVMFGTKLKSNSTHTMLEILLPQKIIDWPRQLISFLTANFTHKLISNCIFWRNSMLF